MIKNTQAVLVSLLSASGLVSAAATRVFVSSYSQSVSTLDFDPSSSQPGVVQKLQPVSVSNQCSDNPSWLTLDNSGNPVLFCINEGLNTANGSLTSFNISSNGALTKLNQVPTLNGPVSGVVYGNNGAGFALAHYGEGAISNWDISNPSHLKLLHTQKFKLTAPPTDPDRQDGPHPHEAVLDPTGNFLVFPDLGADLIRIYSINNQTLALTELPPVTVTGGYGPRHITFLQSLGKTYAYLVTELSNKIVGYGVTYTNGGINFDLMFDISSHPNSGQLPDTVFTAEVAISPCGGWLMVSSRGDNSITIPNFDPNNSTSIVSDPIFNYSIDPETGFITYNQTVPAGGKYPRQFSINEDGTLLAVGLQNDGRVTILERNAQTGQIGGFVAYANIPGQITCAVFDE